MKVLHLFANRLDPVLSGQPCDTTPMFQLVLATTADATLPSSTQCGAALTIYALTKTGSTFLGRFASNGEDLGDSSSNVASTTSE